MSKRMTEKDREDFNNLYMYVKNMLGYDEHILLPKHMSLRLKGLSEGKYMPNNNIKSKGEYSYEVILYTFKFCSIDIKNALKNKSFKDEVNKFNYILKIVEDNLDYMNEKVAKMKGEIA